MAKICGKLREIAKIADLHSPPPPPANGGRCREPHLIPPIPDAKPLWCTRAPSSNSTDSNDIRRGMVHALHVLCQAVVDAKPTPGLQFRNTPSGRGGAWGSKGCALT